MTKDIAGGARRRVALALAVVAVSAVGAAPAQAELSPLPFMTASGNCPANGSSTIFSPATTSDHPAVLRRIRPQGGPGYIDGTSFGARGDYWQVGTALTTSQSNNLSFSCSGSAGFGATVEWFDQPTLPATFSGDAGPNGTGTSEVRFTAPGTAQYVAQLTLTGGAVTLAKGYRFGYPQQTFASSGTFQIGTLGTGTQTLDVVPADGPASHWTVRISALPVAVSGAKFDAAMMRCCDATSLNYTTSGDTNVTVSIVNAYGTSVRVLANDFAVSDGSHSLTWDGRDGGGNPVGDGVYTAVIARHDPSGASGTTYSAPITVDSTAPTAAVSSARVGLNDAVVVNVADASSGVDTASASVDGDFGGYLGNGSPTIVVDAPYSGWTAGSHSLSVDVRDNAGNAATIPLSFSAGAAPPQRTLPPVAPKPAAHPALTNARAVTAVRAAIHKRLRGYRVASASCRATGTRSFSCRFTATRRGRRTTRGTGTIAQATVNGVARYRFTVRRAGSRRHTTWQGTA
jgi:hypothetical protein